MPKSRDGYFVLIYTDYLERMDDLDWGPNEETRQYRVNDLLERGLSREEKTQEKRKLKRSRR